LDLSAQLLLIVDKKKKYSGKCTHTYFNLCHLVAFYRYTHYLRGARRSGLKKEIVTGLSMRVYFLIIFGIGGLAYW